MSELSLVANIIAYVEFVVRLKQADNNDEVAETCVGSVEERTMVRKVVEKCW